MFSSLFNCGSQLKLHLNYDQIKNQIRAKESGNPKPKKKMKFYYHILTQQWAVHIIPVIDFYFESCQPESHEKFWKSKVCGLYLSLSWLRKSFVFGIYKKLK
jgi:hypothetical protein